MTQELQKNTNQAKRNQDRLSPIVEVAGINKIYGNIHAVKDLSFEVRVGEVLGFLGPNGAGKSTTMKLLTGFLPLDGGSVHIVGEDISKYPRQAQQYIGYLPEGAPLYGDMTVGNFLGFIARARGFGRRKAGQAIKEVVEQTRLTEVLDQRLETLSKGFKRRVGLAQAIIHNPKVLILDEPTDGLDPNQKHQVRQLIQNMAKDKAIIVSTHILEEVETICTRAMIINKGQKVLDSTPAQMLAESDGDLDALFRRVTTNAPQPELEAVA